MKRAILLMSIALFTNCTMEQSETDTAESKSIWDSYHTTAQTHRLLNEWHDTYPEHTELYSIGETLKGTDLMVIEITNEATGDASTKPAYYYDGNIHAGELTGAEVALHFAWYLLTNYGSNERVTHLLDTRAVYIRPKFNPDGADISLTSIENPRSTPRPYDQDQDGKLDEDGRNDLNGDGVYTQMRIPNPDGRWKISDEDPRLMVRRDSADTEGSFYDVYSEGIDDDGDGEFNEDGLGGIDMNRNFPRNWGPEEVQRGAGPHALSEPETQATINFISSHKNITGVFHGHTSGGFLFRLPSTTSWDDFNVSDQNLIVELSEKYEETTGQRAVPSYTNPNVHRHGTLISWSYWDFGVPAFVPEFWGAGEDYDGDGSVSGLERLQWNDQELNGEGFVNWQQMDHPELGKIEVGGWNRKFTLQNPPPKMLEEELKLYIPWMLWLAEISPRVIIKKIDLISTDNPDEINLKIRVSNEGVLPTFITQRAIEAEIATPVVLKVDLSDSEIIKGQSEISLGLLSGSRQSDFSGSTYKEVDLSLRITGDNPEVTLTSISEKGGTSSETLSLNRN